MASGKLIGSVSELWRFPVKSMKGERLDEVEVGRSGVLGDRAFALIDSTTGKVISAKSVRLFPNLMACRATFTRSPEPGRELPPVRISFPDGTAVTSDSAGVDRVLSDGLGREVTLAQMAPDDFTIDQYVPDIEGLDPAGRRDEFIEQKLGSALFAEMGVQSPVAKGSFLDVFPFSIMTTSTLESLGQLQPASRFDQRRFRMNVIVDTDGPGFPENNWINRELEIGADARFMITMPDPRCVMTTLAQDDLPKDNEILKTLARHNRIQVGDLGKLPCAGVYAVLASAGTIRIGDMVRLS
ncbi:MAG: MOSC domain-containing protein [Acidobacteriota bacterium]|nr:MAG: MOSC domain-containing protein [Acidobacteriota bacterium]